MKRIVLMLMMVSTICYAERVPITLEYAKTPSQHSFGLMQRKSLPEDQGMLFIYPEKNYLSIWMFNCFIDLSVAFLDESLRIQEIRELKAYPEKMDPRRPVFSYQDLSLYPIDDPIVQFFMKNSVHSSIKTQYVLEMNAGWFYTHRISIGDRLVFDASNPKAYIEKAYIEKSYR